MLVYSHRGLSIDTPENTEEAFARALALGVDGIETDVRLTADGRLVLWHDRHTPRGRAVAEVTHAELELEAGFAVPTLEAAFERFPAAVWNVEIKTRAAGAAALPFLRAEGTRRRLLLTSFCHDVVERYLVETEIPCGLLVVHRPLRAAELVAGFENVRRRPEAVVWSLEFLDASIVDEARGLGLENFAFTVDTPDEHATAREWGFDGVITDWPDRAFAARAMAVRATAPSPSAVTAVAAVAAVSP